MIFKLFANQSWQSWLPRAILLVAIAVAVVFWGPKQTPTAPDLRSLAREVLAKCAGTPHHPSCYDEEIPKLMDKISMEDAFLAATIIQDNDPSYNYCHVLGHKLSAREFDKGTGKWTEIIKRCPTGICSNGCLHGAAQERFRGEVLTPEQQDIARHELKGVCDPTPQWQLTGLEQAECFHGVGHVIMYITGADIPKAMKICDEVAYTSGGGDQTSLCHEGAFMQLFQPLEPEDFALIEGIGPKSKDELFAYCQSFEKQTWRNACWDEGFPLFRGEVNTADGTVEYCSKADEAEREHCYRMLFYAYAQGTNYDPEKLSAYCSALTGSRSGSCFGHMANAIIHGGRRLMDRAPVFCSLVKNTEEQKECYGIIVEFAEYNISVSSADFVKLCNELPNPFEEQCLAKRG